MPNVGDIAVRYSSTPADRGIYLYGPSGWAKQTAPTTDMIAKAWPDICRATLAEANGGFPGGPYGVLADYIGSGVNFQEVLAVQTAFIQKLFAQFIKVQSGGSIRGGDRYDESGATVDGTKPGFYIAASGACKFAGIEFEGSEGNNVEWGCAAQIGSTTTFTGKARLRAAALSATRIAAADDAWSVGANNINLYAFDWNGSTFSQSGSSLLVTNSAFPPDITPIGPNAVAVFVNGYGLGRYTFSGSAWSLTGSVTSFAANSYLLCRTGGDSVLMFTPGYLEEWAYSGGAWSRLNQTATASTFIRGAFLGDNMVVISTSTLNNQVFYIYKKTAGTWSQFASYTLSGTRIVDQDSSVPINNSDFIMIVRDSVDSNYIGWIMFRVDAFGNITPLTTTDFSGSTLASSVALTGTDIAWFNDVQTGATARVYRFGYSLCRIPGR